MAGNPLATLGLPTEALVGETLNFSVGFDNASSTDTGYGPYVDLFLPTTGADGAGAATDDGIAFVGATYLGAPVTAAVLTFNASGQATHPYARDSAGAPVVVAGTPGDQLVVLQLPFGSFTPDQPAAPIAVSTSLSNLADVGTALIVRARGGFQYGNDPLDNPTTDPTIIGATSTAAVTPTLLRLTKAYLGPEDETATGPNFPRQYRITVDIAAGQRIDNLDLADVLPGRLQFVSVDATTVRGTGVATTTPPGNTATTTTPGGTLIRRFASVTGTAAANDAEMLFTFFVPRIDAGGSPVLDATTGDDRTAVDDARVNGLWNDPIDPRDGTDVPVFSDARPDDHTLTAKSIAIQKSVRVAVDTGAPGPSPGDVLEYTLSFQVSDYFAFRDLVATDVFSDGQRFDASFTPTLGVTEHGATSAGAFGVARFTAAGNFSPDPAPNDGTTTVTFRVSDELVARGLDGRLLGGNVPDGGTGGPPPRSFPALFGGTTGTITFRTVIQQEFSDTFPSGDPSVDQGDVLTNSVTVTASLLSVADAVTPTGQSEADTSAASVSILRGQLTKSIYAVNGSTSFTSPVQIAPGDTVTYRLQYTLPTSDFETLSVADFLPLPIFRAVTLTAFDDIVSAAAPATGRAKFGPADTFRAYSGIVPTLTTDATSNRVTFTYGSFDDPRDASTTIDLLLTVAASADPFTDGLFLTNQARVVEGTTNNSGFTQDAIVQITLTEPVVRVVKGVVATSGAAGVFGPAAVGPVAFNAPGTAGARFAGTVQSTNLAATPINSNLSGIDAGDLVTFAIVLENTGSGLNGAFDVRVRDTLPAGFAIPAAGAGLNLRVVDGTGAVVPFAALGTGLFDPAGGIELTDPGTTNPDPGALDRFHATNGRNVIIITFDLQAAGTAQPGQALINTATLFHFAGQEGGPDHTTTDRIDTASVIFAAPSLSKSIDATSETSTGVVSGTERVAVGEVVRFHLVTRIPEGSATNLRLLDNLPAGLQFLNDGTARVALVSSTAGNLTSSTLTGAGLAVAGDETTVAGIDPTFTLPGAAISGGPFGTGTDPVFSLGDLVNADRDADAEFVVLEFNALVDNSAAGSNDAGDDRDNTYFAQVNGAQSGPTSNSVRVRVAEPAITNLDKTVSPTSDVDAGDAVTFTVTFSNPNGAENTSAFDARLLDALPAFLTLNPASVAITTTGGASGVTNNSAGNTLDITFGVVPAGGGVTVTYTATLNANVAPGQAITNTANLTYTSLPGPNGTTGNPTGSNAPGASGSDTGERNGTSGGANDLNDTDPATVNVNNVGPVKSIVATSEAHTGNVGGIERLAVGEVARYRLQVQVPESTGLANFQLIDLLPAGLTFLDDGTALVAFVSNGGGITSTTLSGAGLNQAGNGANVAAITPTFLLAGAAIAGGPFGTGTDPVFSLGDLVNDDRDADAEFVVLEFNALIDNSAAGSNDAGDDRDNTFQVRIGGVQSGPTSNATASRIAEPSVVVAKTAGTARADAGDTVSFRITLTNPAGANATTAFDSRLLDTLPAFLTLNLGSIAITTAGGASGVTNNSAGNTIDLAVATLPAGGSVQVDFTALLSTSLIPGQSVANVASATATSLPGPNGTTGNATGSNTPGASGTDTGERTGSGGVNDLAGTGPAATVTINSNELSGSTYVDADNDGVFDAGETPIGGVTMTLSGTNHLGQSVFATTTTTAGGAYSFTGLRPGSYTITEAQPAGFLDGRDTIGTPFVGTANNDQFANVSIPLGSNITGVGYNFGELRPASVAGSVYSDLDNDGLIDAGEPGIAGAAVTLTGTDDLGQAVSITATSGGGGS